MGRLIVRRGRTMARIFMSSLGRNLGVICNRLRASDKPRKYFAVYSRTKRYVIIELISRRRSAGRAPPGRGEKTNASYISLFCRDQTRSNRGG